MKQISIFAIISLLICSCVPQGGIAGGFHFISNGDNLDRSDMKYLFIHGFGANKCSWDKVKEHIGDGVQALYLDLPGHGKSGPVSGDEYTLINLAGNLADFIEGNVEGDYTIIAHSLGAAVALNSIFEFNIEPSKLILVDPLALPQDIPFFIKALSVPFLSRFFAGIIPPSIQVDIALKVVYFDVSKIDGKIRNCYIENYENPNFRTAITSISREFNNFDDENLIANLESINTPVSLIWGKNDEIIGVNSAYKLDGLLKNSNLHVIDDCGHAPHEECFARFNEIIDGEILAK